MRRLWVLGALLALGACSAAQAAAPAQDGQASTSGSVLTLAFGGDVHFDGELARLLDGDDGLAELRPLLGDADVAVVNLETSITDRGAPEPKTYHFRTSPKALSTLAKAGVDVASMANNHAVDYGPAGLADTLSAKASSPIPIVGVGRDAREAFAPAVVAAKGLSVAVIASTQVNDHTVTTFPATDSTPGVAGNLESNDRLLAAVGDAVARDDVVVVFLHWGTDYESCPDGRQLATAKALEAAGADVIVGGHAHRVQGSGWLGHSYVGYGLGNFVWNNRRGEAEKASGVITVSVAVNAALGRRGLDGAARAARPTVVSAATYTPLRVSDADGIPRPPEDPGALQRAWEKARSCAKLRATP
ncbi:MAG: CapA family protein [Dermatophilaceae bacterium]